MTLKSTLPALSDLKDQAKRLRSALETEGDFITHSDALELIARQYGFRNWNTLHAAVGNRPAEPYHVGGRITGAYLGHAFTGEIRSVRKLADGARYEVTVDFDTPVDVVKSEHFSAFRKRVKARVNRQGVSDSRTSDGQPHMVLGQAA